MAGPTVSTEACVLALYPATEKFARASLFSPSLGSFTAFHRVSRKANPSLQPLDLFDEVSVILDAAPQGDAFFLRESRLTHRHLGIARNYDSLRLASAFTQVVARNPVPEEGRERIHRLVHASLSAFADGKQPHAVYFKALYGFVRDEGYPLKQQWITSLTAADRQRVQELLALPVHELSLGEADLVRLQRRLEDYLRAETDLHLPNLSPAGAR